MCYSAMVVQDLGKLARKQGARVDYNAFADLLEARLQDDRIKIPKAMEANFYAPTRPEEQRIHDLIKQYHHGRTQELEAELFKQKKRLADAERTLLTKSTKAAANDQRIATNKVRWLLDKIRDQKRTTLEPNDSRIYPFHYAPVILLQDDERIIRPMRYHCRPKGKPLKYDKQYAGLYIARRDNLEGFWKGQFGHTQAYVVITGFYENVNRHDVERRELQPGESPENVILCFEPKPAFEMRIACLWSHWEGKDEPPLDSFAAITDEPPPEVAAAGHDRCVIPLKEDHLDAWLNPEVVRKDALYAALDDRERPIYEHRMAA